METVRQVIVKSEELHSRLWSKVVALSENTRYSGITALFIKSLNDVLDLHGKRKMPARETATYFVTFHSIAMQGYQAGLTGKRSPIANLC
jgi:hypothetical protein